MSALYHGGVPGMSVGDLVLPNMSHHKRVDGCPVCEANANGERHPLDLPTPAGWVYATADRQYARFYASKAVKGWLYRVELDATTIEPSTEDPFPTWRASSAVVVSVLERAVQLTQRERRRLFVRWGGRPDEARALLGDGHVFGDRWLP